LETNKSKVDSLEHLLQSIEIVLLLQNGNLIANGERDGSMKIEEANQTNIKGELLKSINTYNEALKLNKIIE
jgi:phage baseplate assembly protein W